MLNSCLYKHDYWTSVLTPPKKELSVPCQIFHNDFKTEEDLAELRERFPILLCSRQGYLARM